MKPPRFLLLSLTLLGLLPAGVRAYDAEAAKDIMGVCATCHGAQGQGGKQGVYPRLAGQKQLYLSDQLKSFRDRHRINIPMFPYTQERELSDEDIATISEYLASIKLETEMPHFKGDEDALTRLEMADRVMIIPRVEGDIVKGGKIYLDQCADCHKKRGQGGGHMPMLVGQYTNYLMKQMEAFIAGDRPHDEDKPGGALNSLKPQDLQDILAYLTSLQGEE